MSEEKEKGMARRVYMLPSDLVERVVQYQQDMKLPSEVEAVRRLLDDALQVREDWKSVTHRFLTRIITNAVLSDVAKDILVGHPLIKSIDFGNRTITFTTTSGEVVTVSSDGTYSAWAKDGKELSSTVALPV